MKAIRTITAIAVIATFCGAWVWAEEGVEAEAGGPPPPPGPELVKAAYLGVGTKPVSETLVHHLDLPEGTGIVVEFVDPESPASKVIRKHDVLHLLNDQILVNQQQLAALIRMHEPGDEVSLTLLRKGKKTIVSTQLAEKELPRLSHRPWHMPRIDFGHPRFQRWIPRLDEDQIDDVRSRVKEMLDQWGTAPDKIGEMMDKLREGRHANGSVHIELKPGPAAPDTQISVESRSSTKSVVTTTDARRSFTLTTGRDGHRHLAVSDHTGKILFNSPVNTPEEIARIPPELKAGYDKVAKMSKDMGAKTRPNGNDVL